jgi:hypothetical protein
MAPDDTGWLEWAFKGLVGAFFVVGGYLGKGVTDDVRELQKDHYQSELALAAYKLEVERSFAKEVSVQASLGRIHDRMDEIGDDIKKLIGAVGQQQGGLH